MEIREEDLETLHQINPIKKFVIDQLLNSKDLDLRYKIRWDILHNKDYISKLQEISDTKLDKEEIVKKSALTISRIDCNIFKSIKEMNMNERALLMGDTSTMDKFLSKVKELITMEVEQDGMFLQKCSKCIC